MDWSAFIVVIILSALFLGFVVWLNIHSRKSNAEEISPQTPETGLKEE